MIRIHPAEHLSAEQGSKVPSADVASEESGLFRMSADLLEDQLLEEARACLAEIRVTGDSNAADNASRRDVANRQQAVRQREVSKPSGEPRQQAVQRSVMQLAVAKAATEPKAKASTTARVQLRLSKSMVRILKGFSQTGRAPSAIVERALWRDSSVQDAAMILRIER